MDTTRPTRQRQLVADGLVFPEGPRWRGDRLWFSDMYAGEVLTVDLQGHVKRIAHFDDHTAGLGFLPGAICWSYSRRRSESCV